MSPAPSAPENVFPPTDVVAGTEKLAARCGQPDTREYRLELDQEAFDDRARIGKNRVAEVLLAIRRTNGKYLLHTKSYYPSGAYRIPTGGIDLNEDLESAVRREVVEETGLQVSIKRFLGILKYLFYWEHQQTVFYSYVFLIHEKGGTLAPTDSSEEISGFREVAVEELPAVAEMLESSMPPAWAGWGHFRAIGHRFVYEKLMQAGVSAAG